MSGNPEIGRLKGGFCVYWYEPDGRRRRYELRARDFQSARKEAIVVYRAKTRGPAAEPTVDDIMAAYIETLGTRPSAKTAVFMWRALAPHFGGLLPRQIDHKHCTAYTAARRAAGRSDGTIWTELGYLRSAMNWAVKRTMIAAAPHIERPAKPDPDERYLTRDEIARLLDIEMMPHTRLAILLMLGTAGRIGAILGLTWDRVNFDEGSINLRVEDETGRRKGRAVVPMNAGLRRALGEAADAAMTDHVIEWGGRPVRSVRKGVSTALKAAGIRDAKLHTFRHTAAVHMLGAGVPIEKVGQYLGHENLNVTYRIYGRFQVDHLRDGANVLDFDSARAQRSQV